MRDPRLGPKKVVERDPAVRYAVGDMNLRSYNARQV